MGNCVEDLYKKLENLVFTCYSERRHSAKKRYNANLKIRKLNQYFSMHFMIVKNKLTILTISFLINPKVSLETIETTFLC